MTEKIGRFEIVSLLAQSPFAMVYKANDGDAQQTVALKVVSLDKVRDRSALAKSVFEESERAKSLSSHNIAGLYGVGDEENLLLAAAEYIQGNSVATTLARHEGFSIWTCKTSRGRFVRHWTMRTFTKSFTIRSNRQRLWCSGTDW